MTGRAELRALPALLALCACSGCMLIPIPVRRTLPDPIRQVVVVQEGTGGPVADAEVVMYAEPLRESFSFWPPHYAATFTPPGKTSLVIELEQGAPGRYTPRRRRVWRYVWPYGIGPWAAHDDYTVTVSARAKGYVPVTATYCFEGPPNVDQEIWKPRPHFSFPQFARDGTLTVILRGTHADASDPAKRHRELRAATGGGGPATTRRP